MKKLFIAIVALAAATACSNDDIISIDRQVIGFGNPFVENAVRADYSSSLVNSFKVYGTVTGNGNTVTLYNGATVTRGTATYGSPFTCTQTEYWVPNCSYAFQAVVDGEIAVVDNKQVINYTVGQDTDNDDISDLLYATATAKTDENAVPTLGVNSNGVVVFTFEHLLSKVGFTFTNTTGGKYSYDVTSVLFVDYNKVGTYTIGGDTNADGKDDGSWGSYTIESTNALSFGAPGVVASTTPVSAPTTHQIIPGTQTLKVTINYVIRYNNTKISATSIAEKPLTYTFEKGKSYNITVAIPAPGQPIQFSVAEENGIGAWGNGGSTELK